MAKFKTNNKQIVVFFKMKKKVDNKNNLGEVVRGARLRIIFI